MKAFITGITGFAGTHLAEHLLACGDDVLGCSQGGKWRESAPPELAANVRMLRWEISQPASSEMRSALSDFRPDVVYHLAALSVPSACGESEPTPEATAVNVEGVRHVIESVSELDEPPRVLLVSSRHVYGPQDLKNHRARETPWVHPQSAYGKTKLAAEWLAREMMETHGVEPIIVRAFSHTGPRQLPPLMVPQWCERLAHGEKPLSIDNDNTWVDLSDVRDVVRAYRLLARHGETAGIYNVGSGKARRTGYIARQLAAHAARRYPIESGSSEERRNPIASIRTVETQTGWRPEIPLKQTLADTWQFWVERAAATS